MKFSVLSAKIKKIPLFKRLFGLVLLFESIYLFYSLSLFTLPNAEYIYEGQELVSKYGVYLENFLGEYGNGYYLDNGIHPDEKDLISLDEGEDLSSLMTIGTPALDLHRGSYQISVNYVTDDNTQTCIASSKYNTYQVITGRQNMDLDPQSNSHTFSLYSPLKVEGYQIQVEYSDCGYLFISNISIQETNAWKNINLLLAISFFLLINFLLIRQFNPKARLTRKRSTALFALAFLILFSSMPILSFYLPDGHDLNFHLYRIETIKDALLIGQFPVRMSPSWCNGYGYAASVFYGELFLYFPALLRIVGFTVQSAYKIYLFTVNVTTCLIAYYCFRKIFASRLIGFCGCALYVLSPYRLACLYLRASVGEYTALTFLPLILYGLYLIYSESHNSTINKTNWIPLSLGFTGLIQCHVLSSVIAFLFTLLFCIIMITKTLQIKRLLQLIWAAAFTLVLNIWFILPFLDYLRFDYNVTDPDTLGRFQANGAFLSQLFGIFPSGSGASCSIAEGLGSSPEMAYTIGGGLMAAGALYLLYRLYTSVEKSTLQKAGDIAFGLGVLALCMSTIWFPWDFIQQLNGLTALLTQNIQFPWRFLGVASLFLSFAAACLISYIKASKNQALFYTTTAALSILCVLSSGYFLSDYMNHASQRYIPDDNVFVSTDIMLAEYLPAGTDSAIFYDQSVLSGTELNILSSKKENGVITISCFNPSSEESYADVPFLCYKGYTAVDTSSKLKLAVTTGEGNRLRILVPSGYSGTFKVKFDEPWYWKFSEWISIATLLSGIIFLLRRSQKQHI